jgi:hypothetical protein
MFCVGPYFRQERSQPEALVISAQLGEEAKSVQNFTDKKSALGKGRMGGECFGRSASMSALSERFLLK